MSRNTTLVLMLAILVGAVVAMKVAGMGEAAYLPLLGLVVLIVHEVIGRRETAKAVVEKNEMRRQRDEQFNSTQTLERTVLKLQDELDVRRTTRPS